MPAHSSLRYPKKTLMKASSFDVIRQMSFGGESGLDSVPGISLNQDNAPSSLAFQVGNTNNDDVFTDQPVSECGRGGTAPKVTQDVIKMTSTESESATQPSQRRADGTQVLRDPPQIDAQNIYPSLTQAFDDRRLEIEVTKYFSQFGTVFAKIRRDSRQMPFAFCQFTRDADAESAEKFGSGAVILGRPCRVEKATANSCFVVYKISGDGTSRQEAIDLLGVLGPIAKVYPLDHGNQKGGNLPPAMVVLYKRYDASRSVVKAFENHPVFRVDAFDPKTETRQQPKRSDQNNYAQYEKDRRSAYFGNLPLAMTADDLKSLASSCGKVLCAEVAMKEVPQPGGMTVTTRFGFVEFARPDSIDNAIANFHRKPIDGYILKVERKRSRTFNGLSSGINGSQRGPHPVVSPSTWHGGRGNNRHGHATRIMNADTFVPLAAGPPTTHLAPGAERRGEDGATSPPSMGDEVRNLLLRMSASQYVRPAATGPVPGEEASAATGRLPTAVSHSSNCQPSGPGLGLGLGLGMGLDLGLGQGHMKEAELGRAVQGKSIIKDRGASGGKAVISHADIEDEADGQESAATAAKALKKFERAADGNHRGKMNEDLDNPDSGKSAHGGAKTRVDRESVAATPTKPPVKAEVKTPNVKTPNVKTPNVKTPDVKTPDAKVPPEYGAEPAASCFYPIIPPFPYSPYGFHPIQPLQPFMANPLTPQGGPLVYNSFGHTYYSPTPYSDMYAMYPMVQQYAAAPMETPTRPSASSQSAEAWREDSPTESSGMSPKSGDRADGKGKAKAR
ncbi:hypothetical protein Trco_003637 [Trichoderma cornu-damae]|uniref:RRM domain-containing protein n=1 Tax=Trichoderma cornu-damae TaxID=654480 RepID=A0A9P8TW62_9HYPO|nr:hypothetical protein Trco_003637 [Trichoderma cornu-damae]